VRSAKKELRTDHLDILLIHGTPGLEQMSVEQAMKIHAELVKLRNEKITRFIGFSARGYFDKALALINSGGFEMCMLSYGYIPRGSSQVWSARATKLRDECLAKAHERSMGIVAMKVIGGGWLGRWAGYLVPGFDKQGLAQLPGAAIRHVLQDTRVHLLRSFKEEQQYVKPARVSGWRRAAVTGAFRGQPQKTQYRPLPG
jgi:predicted aldo/keto reductase-like oxidoreductase